MKFAFPNLTGILTSAAAGLLPSGLGNILTGVLGHTVDPKSAALSFLNGRLDAQEGRTGGKALGWAVGKQIDNAISAHGAALSVDQAAATGTALAQIAAAAHGHAGELLLAYPPLQAKVEALKAAGKADTDPELIQARAARNTAKEAYIQACIDIARAAAGENILAGK